MRLSESGFAGSWYPYEAEKCRKQINEFLSGFDTDLSIPVNPVAAVVPHAGWFFSGRIACNAIKRLSENGKTDVVAVFGMHMLPSSVPCMLVSDYLETPFGSLHVHQGLASHIETSLKLKFEKSEGVFRRDNTIELQMPFINYFFGDVKIIAIGVPPSDSAYDIGRQVVDSASSLGLKIRIIASTDLTHYGSNYGFEPKGRGDAAVEWVKKENDSKIIAKMCALDPEGIINEAMRSRNACCPGAVAAFASAVREKGMAGPAVLMDYYTSNDVMPSGSFVGYAGILV